MNRSASASRSCAGLGEPDGEQLALVVPLVQRLGRGQPLVALQPDQRRPERAGERLGRGGLADPGLALEQQRPAELERQVQRGGQAVVDQVVDRVEPLGELVGRRFIARTVRRGRGVPAERLVVLPGVDVERDRSADTSPRRPVGRPECEQLPHRLVAVQLGSSPNDLAAEPERVAAAVVVAARLRAERRRRGLDERCRPCSARTPGWSPSSSTSPSARGRRRRAPRRSRTSSHRSTAPDPHDVGAGEVDRPTGPRRPGLRWPPRAGRTRMPGRPSRVASSRVASRYGSSCLAGPGGSDAPAARTSPVTTPVSRPGRTGPGSPVPQNQWSSSPVDAACGVSGPTTTVMPQTGSTTSDAAAGGGCAQRRDEALHPDRPHDLGQDRQRDLLGGPRADVQAGRGVHPGPLGVGQAHLLEHRRAPRAAGDQADEAAHRRPGRPGSLVASPRPWLATTTAVDASAAGRPVGDDLGRRTRAVRRGSPPRRRSGCRRRPRAAAPAAAARRKISRAPPDRHGLTTTRAPGDSGKRSSPSGSTRSSTASPSSRAVQRGRRAPSSARTGRRRSPRSCRRRSTTAASPGLGRVGLLGPDHRGVHERHPRRASAATTRSAVRLGASSSPQIGGVAWPCMASHTRDGVSGMSACRTP